MEMKGNREKQIIMSEARGEVFTFECIAACIAATNHKLDLAMAKISMRSVSVFIIILGYINYISHIAYVNYKHLHTEN